MLDRIVIVGAGRTTALLMETLRNLAPIVVLDTNAAALDELPERADDPDAFGLTKRVADGTSRLVLEDARGEPRLAVALVAAAGDDRQNVEICRLAGELGYRPVAGIVIDHANTDDYKAAGAITIVRASILGQVVERMLRHDGLTIATTVGQGKGEIIEFVVLPGSPVIGVPLSQLGADGWRIAAIYRDDELVLPTGKTKIAADDRVLVVGAPGLLTSVAEQLRIGAPMFPRRHGARVIVYLPRGRDREIEMAAEVLAIKTRATGLVRVHPNAAPASLLLEDETTSAIELVSHQREKSFEDVPLSGADVRGHIEQLAGLRPGVVVARCPPRRLLDRVLGRGGTPAALCNALRAPVLFPRGAPHPARVVHVMIHGIADMRLADTAIDLARMLSLPLAVARVVLPEYLETRDQEADRVLGEIERRTRLYGLRADTIELEGNPVRQLIGLAQPADLFVVGRRRTTQDSFTSPDIALRIAQTAACSILVQTLEGA